MANSHRHQLFSSSRLGVSTLGLLLLLAASPICLPTKAQTGTPALDFGLDQPTNETNYTLGAGDRIRVDIFQVPDFSREYLVLVDGTVGFPLIGTITVEGLTLSQLSELLTQRYAAFVKRPLVTVGLLAPRPLKIAVSGEVNSPGSYTIPIELGQKFPSVTDIIQQAGGVTATADVSEVQVQRSFQGKRQVVTLNLWELFSKGNQAQNITLRNGDSIIIPTKQEIDTFETFQLADANFGIRADEEINVVVVGEVFRPGAYKILPERIGGSATTGPIRRQLPTITQAIQAAGGIRPLADIRRIELRRFTREGYQKAITIDLWKLLESGNIEEDLILKGGDTIVIPTAKELPAEESEALADASFAPNTIRVTVTGEVLRPGVLELPPNTPLNQALQAAGGFNKRRADEASVELIRLNPNGTVTKRDLPIDLAKGINPNSNPTLRNKDVVIVRRNGLAATTDFLSTLFSPIGAITGTVRGFFPFFN